MSTTVRYGTVIGLDDGDYTVSEAIPGALKLRHQLTGQFITVAPADLPRRMRETPAAVFRDLIPLVESQGNDKSLFWVEHIREVADGTPIDAGAEPRAEYHPTSTSRTARVQRKARELTQLGVKTSERSIWRKLREFEDGGAAALMRQKPARAELPLDRADARYVEVLKEVIAEQTKRSTSTATALLREVKLRLLDRYPGEAVPLPSKSAFDRHFNYLTKGKYTTGAATTRRSAATAPTAMYRTRRRMRVGEEVQIDSTPLDVECLDDNGVPVRPTLTIALDVATRSIIASTVRLDAAKGYDHAFLLARMLVPRRSEPGYHERWAKAARQLPWLNEVSFSERDRVDASRPYIVPESLTIDGGRDFRSVVLEAACKLHGIDITYARPRRPTDKPHVERAFRSIKDGLSTLLPGYTGGSVQHRGHAIERQPLITIDALNEAVDFWIGQVYQNTVHEGLNDPYFPKVLLTPNQMFAALWDLSGAIPVPFAGRDFIDLLPAVGRQIRTTGIQHEHRLYDSPALDGWRNITPPGADEWQVRVHPYDPRAVWVRLPGSDDYVEVPDRTLQAYDLPFATEMSGSMRTARQQTEPTAGELLALEQQIYTELRNNLGYAADRRPDGDDLPGVREAVALRFEALEKIPGADTTEQLVHEPQHAAELARAAAKDVTALNSLAFDDETGRW